MATVTAASAFVHSYRHGINDPARAAAWIVWPGQPLAWRVRRPMVLRVQQGRLWVTLDVEAVRVPGQLGDHFLEAGQCLCVPAGARLVLEALVRPGEPGCPARFAWTRAPRAGRDGDVWGHWDALRAGLAQTLRAALALGRGLAAHARVRVLGG
jgi:hypothetical protein